MATIELYTDLEQSKKLAEILPLESADMSYTLDFNSGMYGISTTSYKRWIVPKYAQPDNGFGQVIPCWSLAALLGILAKQNFIIKSLERNNEYQYNIDIPSRHCKIWFSSLLDAAFEMVCWLKKNGK